MTDKRASLQKMDAKLANAAAAVGFVQCIFQVRDRDRIAIGQRMIAWHHAGECGECDALALARDRI
jgi:hypothetical protein